MALTQSIFLVSPLFIASRFVRMFCMWICEGPPLVLTPPPSSFSARILHLGSCIGFKDFTRLNYYCCRTKQHYTLMMMAGDVLLFTGIFAHGGAGFIHINIRLHMHLDAIRAYVERPDNAVGAIPISLLTQPFAAQSRGDWLPIAADTNDFVWQAAQRCINHSTVTNLAAFMFHQNSWDTLIKLLPEHLVKAAMTTAPYNASKVCVCVWGGGREASPS